MKYKENKMQKKYSVVFIVRKINDLDHMLPLICKFAKEGNFVRVMTLDVKKIDNYLTNYMYGKHNLKVETPVVNNINKISRFLVFIFDKFIILAENNRWHTLLKYLKFIYRYTKRRILSREDFKDSAIIDYDNTDIIIVDKTNVIKNKIYKNITKHASVNNIPIIRLQHGIDMRLTSIGDNSDLLVHDYGNKVFDIYYSIVEIYQETFSCREECCGKKIGKNEIKTFVLGNMRFSKEWVKKYKEIEEFDKVSDPQVDIKKHNIVIIISAPHFIYADKVASLLNAVSDRFDVNIIYKPHTRHKEIDLRVKELLNKNVRLIYSYKNTASLMSMSDIVLLCGNSSVALHAVIDAKPVIFAEYTTMHPTYYSKYLKECTSMSEDEALSNIENILYKNIKCIKTNSKKKLVSAFINPNNSKDIIEDYYNLTCDLIHTQ
jgi:hypothetical protein